VESLDARIAFLTSSGVAREKLSSCGGLEGGEIWGEIFPRMEGVKAEHSFRILSSKN
jgi:hypothetical protein